MTMSGGEFDVERTRRLLSVALAVSIGGLAGCASEVAAPELTQTQDDEVPPAAVEYIEALNAADQQALALLMAFPGTHYPDEEQVAPDDIPQACMDGELDALGGLGIDTVSADVMGRYADYDVDVENSSREQPSGQLVTFELPDSTSVERLVLVYPDRALIEPEWTAECTAAAEELYG